VVTFSQWRPDGGYNYFEVAKYTAPFGNDLPDPAMPAPTEIGVPSVEVGHAIPRGAVHAGEGELPVGIIAPMDTSRLSNVLPGQLSPVTWICVGAAVVGLAWLVHSRWAKR
jgi:hypothetical protein